jgi:hypothetical protein
MSPIKGNTLQQANRSLPGMKGKIAESDSIRLDLRQRFARGGIVIRIELFHDHGMFGACMLVNDRQFFDLVGGHDPIRGKGGVAGRAIRESAINDKRVALGTTQRRSHGTR